jgi:dTDP-4-dehydrorhamnose reductase
VYSEFGNNFVKTMLRLGSERDEINVVGDQIGSPTNARDLAGAILEIIPQLSKQKQCDEVEIYHYSNAGVCSWYDFASAIFEINDVDCKVNLIPSEVYPTPAKRPYYSVMDKSKIAEAFKLQCLNWRECLDSVS